MDTEYVACARRNTEALSSGKEIDNYFRAEWLFFMSFFHFLLIFISVVSSFFLHHLARIFFTFHGQIWSAILTMSLLILGAIPTPVLNADGVYTVSTYYWQQVSERCVYLCVRVFGVEMLFVLKYVQWWRPELDGVRLCDVKDFLLHTTHVCIFPCNYSSVCSFSP